MPAKSVAIAVVEHADHFLVGIREPGIALAGYAEFPGGKVETNESPDAAAVRECREESGLDIIVIRLLHEIEFDYPHGLLHIHFYLCEPKSAATALTPPLAGTFRWVRRAELGTLKFPPANDGILKWLLSKTE